VDDVTIISGADYVGGQHDSDAIAADMIFSFTRTMVAQRIRDRPSSTGNVVCPRAHTRQRMIAELQVEPRVVARVKGESSLEPGETGRNTLGAALLDR